MSYIMKPIGIHERMIMSTSCSKAALNMLSAAQLGEGVKSIALRPGTVDTSMLRHNLEPDVAARIKDVSDSFVNTVEGSYRDGSVLRPEQPAETIAALAATPGAEWPPDLFTVTSTGSLSSAGSSTSIVPLCKNWVSENSKCNPDFPPDFSLT